MKSVPLFFGVLCLIGCVASAAEPLMPVDFTNLPPGVVRIDLFLLIGQSNMKGRGAVPAQQAVDPRIVMMQLKNDQWYLARPPPTPSASGWPPSMGRSKNHEESTLQDWAH